MTRTWTRINLLSNGIINEKYDNSTLKYQAYVYFEMNINHVSCNLLQESRKRNIFLQN